MGASYIKLVRDRLRSGDVAVYERRNKTRYLYHRDGHWYRLKVTDSPYLASEQQLGYSAFRDKVKDPDNYPVNVVEASEVYPAVRARSRNGDEKAVVAEWLADARQLVDRLEVGEAGRDDAKRMISTGARLQERVDGDASAMIEERIEKIGDAVNP